VNHEIQSDCHEIVATFDRWRGIREILLHTISASCSQCHAIGFDTSRGRLRKYFLLLLVQLLIQGQQLEKWVLRFLTHFPASDFAKNLRICAETEINRQQNTVQKVIKTNRHQKMSLSTTNHYYDHSAYILEDA
jgi:hypothetical protein